MNGAIAAILACLLSTGTGTIAQPTPHAEKPAHMTVLQSSESQYPKSPFVFPIEVMTHVDNEPAVLLLGYLDKDNRIDFVLVGNAGITAYGHDGHELWKLKEESTFNQRQDRAKGTALSYHATAGVIGNHSLYFVRSNQIELAKVNGSTRKIEQVLSIGPEAWTDVGLGHVFSKEGPEDVILLKDGYIGGFTGYRNTNRVAAIAYGETKIRWSYETRNHQGIAFAHMRIGDVDGDGYDEVCTGRVCIDHDGQSVLMHLEDPIWKGNPFASYTTLQVGDFFPERPGWEAFCGHYFIGRYGVHSFAYGSGGFHRVYKSASNVHSAVVGNVDLKPSWVGPEVLIRSNKDGENNPPDIRHLRFLNLATGEEVIQEHIPQNSWRDAMEDGRPKGSYPRFIDWDGDDCLEVCLVQRHTPQPKASVNDVFSGRCLLETSHHGLGEGMVRIFDVSGDGREEVVVWNHQEIAVYFNPDPPKQRVRPKRRSRDYVLRSRHGSFVYNYPQ